MNSLAEVLRGRKETNAESSSSVTGTLGTLRREGIAPSSNARIISNTLHSKSVHSMPLLRTSTNLENRMHLLEQRQWIALGEGWFQATHPHTGSTSRCGLHSVIESTINQCFLCTYIPRTKTSYQAVTGPNAEFDLELAVKLYSKENNQFTLAQIGKEIIVSQAFDESLRCNIFYNLLVQIRCNALTLDVNGVPLFTNIRINGVDDFGGIIGLCAKNSKFAVKGWKLKGAPASFRSKLPSGAISASEEAFGRREQEHVFSFSKLEHVLPKNSFKASAASSNLNVNVTSSIKPSTKTFQYIREQLEIMFEKSIVDSVLQDIINQDLGVSFDDIAASSVAKRLLNEAILLPVILPEFFTGIREPWKGVLLFGPPGTGKTMLAKAVCGFQNSSFFNCSAASLISKYRGDSEKIVKCLFHCARLCAPSVIFMDEIDALVSNRGSDFEHEASRRLKTELFSQIDGLAVSEGRVILLAATNCPWDLDPAMRRRLEKRIYISLPDQSARMELVTIFLKSIPISDDVNNIELANRTDGYSGADIQIAFREASMMPMRRLLSIFSPSQISEMKQSGNLAVPKVTMADFILALQNTRPSVSAQSIRRYKDWEAEFSNK